MAMRHPVWTTELAAAARAIANDERPQDETRRSLADDIRARAREFATWAQPGIPLTDVGVSLMQQLRSRLADPYVDFKPASDELERSWTKAWQSARIADAAFPQS